MGHGKRYIFLVSAVAIVGGYIYKRWKEVKIPTNWQQVGTVKRLLLFPLKSGHRIELQKAEVTEYGIKQTADQASLQMRDRMLMVYDAKELEFRTGRHHPKLVSVEVSVHDENHVAFDAPNMRTLYVKIPNRNGGSVVNIKCCQKEVIPGIDCGDEAATWFSRFVLQKDSGLRLGYNDASQRRDISKAQEKVIKYYTNLRNQSTGLFSDLTSLSLISERSVTDLNKTIGNSDIPTEQFRHNVIIDGPHLQAFEEDNWDWIKIGDVVVRNVKECTRCIMTVVNPETGIRDSKREPLKTLEAYRRSLGPEKLGKIGVHLEVVTLGVINVGDSVYIPRK